MIVYLASPMTQQQAEHLCEMPVLLSYAICGEWINRGYQQSFSNVLIDSGAFSEFNSGVKIEVSEYAEWGSRWVGHADAIAGLDDISGNWRKSLKNYLDFPHGFPTFHESDPEEFLDDIIQLAKERNQWIGLGLIPPRGGKEKWVRSALDRIPEGIHIHGFALREYTYCRRLNSVDSTNWYRAAIGLKTKSELSHLTYGECLDIVVKRYKRWNRTIVDPKKEPTLYDGLE